ALVVRAHRLEQIIGALLSAAARRRRHRARDQNPAESPHASPPVPRFLRTATIADRSFLPSSPVAINTPRNTTPTAAASTSVMIGVSNGMTRPPPHAAAGASA